jgi:hypothetical protein
MRLPVNKPASFALVVYAILVTSWPDRLAIAHTPNIDEVWALEEAYWEYVQSGDVDHYLTLWHEDFIGWPCALGQMHPAGKSSIAEWVERIRDEKPRFTFRRSSRLDTLS